MINIHRFLFVIMSLLLSGCGTINTVFRGDDVAGQNLRESKTNCGSIPRVYSGVFYDLCILNGPPSTSEKNPAAPQLTPLLLVDFIPSGALDTLLLPYTIYSQVADGNIEIP